ncbi:MAG: hypothetical protein KDB71_02885 [Mycobacterium sp.]|nr:hypothetical protein [Mycobacterium sp.]
MKIGASGSRAVLTTIFSGLLLSAPLTITSPASADCANTLAKAQVQAANDVASSRAAHVGTCWQHEGANWGVSVAGGVCLPGRIGLCLGALQNNDGAVQWQPTHLPAPPAPAASRAPSWP